MLPEVVEDETHGVHFQNVVGAKPTQNVTRSVRKTFLQGVSLTAIRLAHYICEVRRIFPDNLSRTVGRSAINHSDLQIYGPEILRVDGASQSHSYKRSLVISIDPLGLCYS